MATFDSDAPVYAQTSAPAIKQQYTAVSTTGICKRAGRREQCQINQISNLRWKRQGEPTTPICPLSSKEMKSSLVAEWKKAKRKEQCRRAQLKYLRRKREELQKLIGGIKRLKREIKKLEARKAEIRKQQKRRVQFVTSLYSSLQTDIKQQQLPDVRNYERTYGCSPALQVLSDLQREEFDSMESLRLHWGWYRSQFRQFELSVASYECLVAGKHLIVKATGSLRLGIECEDNSDVIECPVFQQFEFEIGEHDVRRITSEVNLVSFVHGKEPLSPGRILDALSYLSQRFALQTNVR